MALAARFELLSVAHVVALALIAGAAGAAVAIGHRADEREAGLLCRGLAVLVLLAFTVEQVAFIARGTWTIERNLPLQLSDAVTLLAAAALWRPTPILTELVYFWALSASLQALLTPDLHRTFPSVFFITFFMTHAGAVVAACLLVFGLGRRPRPGAVSRVFACTAVFAGAVAVADLATGANYLYLRDKPDRSSLLDVMGPWPWYLGSAALLALGLFLALGVLAAATRPDRVRRRSRLRSRSPS